MNMQLYVELAKKAFDAGKPVLYLCLEEIEFLRQQLAAKQAEVDALMLEYCPNEMSQEQLANWAAHQRPSEWKTDDELRQQLATRLGGGKHKMLGFRCECRAAIDCTYPNCNEGVEMSSKDITQRLQDYARDYTTTTYHDDLIREAVTEIESLRQQLSERDAELKRVNHALNDNRVDLTITASDAITELRQQLDELKKQNEELMIELCRRSTK